MSWHTDCWPGLVALLCSDKAADKDYCTQQLALDSAALASCKEQSKGSLFLQNLCRMSPLATKPMSEWAELLNPVSQTFAATDRQALEELAKETWSSLGQSKVVEDGNREVRRRESTFTLNKTLAYVQQWDTLRSQGVMESHRRQE
eukprot:5265375-Lingulodinium_polyedra.AAC.1